MADDDEMKQLASSHQHYLASMIAEQEAALARFQNSTYLSESTVNNTTAFGASMRGGAATARVPSGAGAAAAGGSGDLLASASASPYTFHRGMNPSSRSMFVPAPTPGYSHTRGASVGRDVGAAAAGRLSPTPSNSSAGSAAVGPNTSVMANARRTLQNAAEWGASTTAGAAVRPPMSGAALTSEAQGRVWSKEHSEWEKRMAELEGRLKRVNNTTIGSTSPSASMGPGSSGLYNVPMVNGRPLGATVGAGGLSSSVGATGSGIGEGRSHNVQTSELVLRLERELGAAVDALVQERKATTARELAMNEKVESLEGEIEARERRLTSLNQKWTTEFESQRADFQEQLEKAFARTQALAAELDAKEAELSNRESDLKKHASRVSQHEKELRDSASQVESLRTEVDRLNRRLGDMELDKQSLEHAKRSTLADMENKAKGFSARMERQKEEWMARMESQKAELDAQHQKDLTAVRKESSELERKARELEHDNFVLATELGKTKELLQTREMELEKTQKMVSMEKSSGEQLLRAEREQLELAQKLRETKLQSALDEAHAALQSASSKLEHESRQRREVASRVSELEEQLRSKSSLLSEKDASIQSLKDKISSLTHATHEAEAMASSANGMVASLRASQQTLLEEVQLLQRKLDSRSSSKVEEIKLLEAEQRKFREKARERTTELEHSLDEMRSRNVQLQARNEALQADFESALQSATREQQMVIEKLDRKVEKLSMKLANRTEEAELSHGESGRLIAHLRAELDRKSSTEELALRQVRELESRVQEERSRASQAEAQLAHWNSVAPDGLGHQRVVQELVAAKQVATSLQAKLRETQQKYERQAVRQTALQNLLQRMQEEQQSAQQFRAGLAARSYLSSTGGHMPSYRPLDNHAPSSSTAAATAAASSLRTGGSSLSGLTPVTVPGAGLGMGTGAGSNFSREEEDLFRSLLRDHERQQRVRAHVHAFAGDVTTTDDESMVGAPPASSRIGGGGGGMGAPSSSTTRSHAPAAARATYSSRIRSRSAPRLRVRARGHIAGGADAYAEWPGSEPTPAGSSYAHGSSSSRRASSHRASSSEQRRRAKDDADVNLNLQVNFDPRVLARYRELEWAHSSPSSPTLDAQVQPLHCNHTPASHLKPHETRACKICQRRAFGRGLDCSPHYAVDQHVPVRQSPTRASYQAKMPHA